METVNDARKHLCPMVNGVIKHRTDLGAILDFVS